MMSQKSFVGLALLAFALLDCSSHATDATDAPDASPPSASPSGVSEAAHTFARSLQTDAFVPRSMATSLESEGDAIVARLAPPTSGTRHLPRPDVRLPKTATGPLSLTLNGRSIEVRLADAAPARGEIVDGLVVYADALGAGSSLAHVPQLEGTEEFVRFSTRPSSPALRYEVALDGIAGLRLVSGVLEFLAADGNPIFRTKAPMVLDADHVLRKGDLRVEGCAFDTDEHPPWGRKPVDPGAARCTVVASWSDEGLTYPILVDPPWTTTGSLAQPRHSHAAALVANSTNAACTAGCVVVTGGLYKPTTAAWMYVTTAELYNAAAGTWAAAGTPSVDPGRFAHTSFPSGTGQAYITGGAIDVSTTTAGAVVASTSIYDPNAATVWTTGPALAVARYDLVSQWIRHPSGAGTADDVIVVGGVKQDGTFSNDNDTMTTVGGATWTAWNSGHSCATSAFVRCMTTPRSLPAIAGFVSGSTPYWVVAGGLTGASVTTGAPTASVEVFDTTSSNWASGGNLTSARSGLAAAPVSDGILFAGGSSTTSSVVVDKFFFSTKVVAATWTPVLSAARGALTGATAGVAPRAFFYGGTDGAPGGNISTLTRADVFTGDGSAASITSDAASGREFHTATSLPNGAVLVAGGISGGCVSPVCGGSCTIKGCPFPTYAYPASDELYRPEPNGTACTGDGDCDSLHCVDGVCCDTTCTDQCAACDVSGKAGTCSAVTGAPHGTRTACDGFGTTCGASCDGTKTTACTYASSTTVCAPPTCDATTDTQTAASMCSGSGACLTPSPTSCREYACGASACKTSCTGVTDCATGYACVGSTCVTTGALGTLCTDDTQCTSKHCVTSDPTTTKVCCKDATCPTGSVCAGAAAGSAAGSCIKTDGQTCSAATDCLSGFCVDGVCCDGLCSGQCEACNVAGAVGKCQGVIGDPHGARPACASGGADVCKALTCDGGKDRTKCSSFKNPLGFVCGAASCTDGTATAASTCDATGTCAAGSTKACAPYVCGGTACKTSCTTDSDCAKGNACDVASSKCVPAKGTCSADNSSSQPPDKTSPPVPCSPYICNTVTGGCFSQCSTTDQCAAGYTCDDNTKTCSAAPPSSGGSSSGGGCGCTTAGDSTSMPFLAVLGLAGLIVARRRRR